MGLLVKNYLSLFKLSETGTLLITSSWHLFLIPTQPQRKGISWFLRILVASSPLFMMSILVKQPMDLQPLGSISLISFRAQLVDKSWLAGITHKMIDLLSLMYRRAMSLVTSQMFLGCLPTGMEVMPGKSTIVRLGQVAEKMLRTMGMSLMIFSAPQILSVT